MGFKAAALGIDEAILPTEWKLKRIDSLAFLNPEQVNAMYPYSQILYLDIANVSAGSYGEPENLPLADAPSRAKRVVRTKDTIISTVRPGNRAYVYVRNAPDNLVASTGFAVVRAKTDTEPRFVYYLLTSNPIINYLSSIAEEKTAYPSVNPEDIAECIVPVPPLPEQRAIAHILGTLDDKIELNRRMSETLEAMARALFKSWFVDFDPVRAKIEGRWRKGESLPGLPAELWEVFPDRLMDSELGEIPEGWKVGCLGSICEVIDCLHTKKPERTEEGRPLLQLWNIRNDGLLDMSDTYWIDEANYEKWIARIEASPGDCVITNVGRVGAVAQIPHGFKAALGRNMTGLRCRRDFIFPTFLIECLLSDSMSEEIRLKIDSGTILDSLNVRSIPYLRFVLATSNTLQSFEKLARPFRQRMEKCLELSFSLSSLRDTFLPKLISGEIRVKDADKFVERAV